jgi:NAD-dependent DNA ligase
MRNSLTSFIGYHLLPKGVGDVHAILDSLNITEPVHLKNVLTTVQSSQVYSCSSLEAKIGPARTQLILDLWSKELKINRDIFLQSLSLNGIGYAASCELIKHIEYIVTYKLIPTGCKAAAPARLSVIENIELITEFYRVFGNCLVIKSEVQIFAKVVITGKLSKPRGELEKEFRSAGVNVVSTVDTETVLICDSPSDSSKYQKAMKLGVEIITESQARERWLK